MNPVKNLEYLFTEDKFDFFIKEEVGFENYEYAIENKLYEDFGKRVKSTYKELFNGTMYQYNTIHQIWVFNYETKEAVGLYLFIENEDIQKNKPVGQINLYTKPEFRNLGLSKLAIDILDHEIEKKFTKSKVELFDDACYFSKYIQKNIPITNIDLNSKDIKNEQPIKLRTL